MATHIRLFCIVTGLAPLMLSGSSSFAQSTAKDEQEKARQGERERRQLQEQEDAVKRILSRLIFQAEEASSKLARLSEQLGAYTTRLEKLLTDEHGKRIAHDPVAFMAVLRFYERPMLDPAEVRARAHTIQDILKSLSSEEKRIAVGFIPSEKVQDDIVANLYWARERLAVLAATDSELSSLIERAPKVTDLESARTLKQVRDDYQAARLSLWADARRRGEEEAKPESEQMVTETARIAELERANAEAERLLSEARAEIERMRIDQEIEYKRMRADQAERLAEADIRFRDLLAEVQRLQKLAAAERHAKNVDAETKSEDIYSASEKQRLVQRCKDPEVQRLLAPFLAHGYWQPGNSRGSFEKGPVSLAALRAFGALEPTTKGLERLLNAGTNRSDKERPRWGYTPNLIKLDSAQRDELRTAQQMLVELGDVMVELGMLQP